MTRRATQDPLQGALSFMATEPEAPITIVTVDGTRKQAQQADIFDVLDAPEVPVPAPYIAPTVPGMAPGVIGLNPLRLQCGVCGDVWTHDGVLHEAAALILSGFHFHAHGDSMEKRMCPSCLSAARAACDRPECRRH